KFHRLSNAETRKHGGSGLWLALVKAIVEAHGGQVWVESAFRKGSTFFLTLPVAAQDVPVTSTMEALPAQKADIILVEDDHAYASLLREHLESAGLSVTTTGYAEHALDLVRLAAPRLSLVDIHLAGHLDGWDFVIALQNDPALCSLPIVILSASSETAVDGLALAGATHLQKSSAPQYLRQHIQQHLPSLA